MPSSRFLLTLTKFRNFSAHVVHAPAGSVHNRVRKFILSNKNLLGEHAHGPLTAEPSKAVSTIQQELLSQLEEVDINPHEFKLRNGGETSKDSPNLVPFDEERRVVGCVCHEEYHHVNYLLLHKGITTRCQCGHWYKLVDLNEYEAARDRYWKKIQVQPDNAQLMKDLEDSEASIARLLEESKNMTRKSEGSEIMLDKLSIQWNKYKNAYRLIRKKIDEAPFTEIR